MTTSSFNSTICTAFLLAVLTFFPSASFSQTEEKVKIRQLAGAVEVLPASMASWRPARLGMVLKTGWDVRTFVESSVELEYESGTIIRIGENSVVTISSLVSDKSTNTTRTGIKVPVGQVWANVKKLTSTQSRFDFETPTAVASIRGTRLGITVIRGKTSVNVYEGAVSVRNKKSGSETAVKTNEQAVVSAELAGIIVSEITPAENEKGKPVVDPFTGDTLKAADSVAAATDSTGGADSSGTGKSKDTLKPAPCPPDKPFICPDGTCAPDAASCGKTKSELLQLDIKVPPQNTMVNRTPVFLSGKTEPGAQVKLSGKETAVGSDGAFSDFVELKPGPNSIAVIATRGAEARTVLIAVNYHPPLYLNVANIIDNMEVVSAELELDIEISDGAQFSVNGKTGVTKATLTKGKNQITVAAWDSWNSRTEKNFIVIYMPPVGFVLEVASPKDNAVIAAPMIPVSGSTIPGARVTVNGTAVPVNTSGFFSAQIPIPDEARDYTIDIVSRLKSDELSVSRTITYAPPVKPLELVVSSPSEGQVIKTSSIRIAGRTSPGAGVKVNGRPAVISAQGLLTADVQVSEKDIGGYDLEVIASRDDQELSKSVQVKVDIASPQINTSVPRIQVTGLGRPATRTQQVSVQVFDQTPGDQITVTVTNNGIAENYTLDPGSRESINLNEGKNRLLIRARDLAGNQAQPMEADIYYLPGPLEIAVIEPDDINIDIQDLPPWPRASAAITAKIHFRVEIRDNIGTVPETIKYCRVTSSAGQTVVLNNERNYYYYGDMAVGRGSTAFTIQVEDLAGTIQMKKIDVRVRQ